MTELARGRVADRPWGRTLGALGTRGLTGQLTLTSQDMQYRIAFEHGGVVGATSPLVADAAVRLALTGGLVMSTQVADITRRVSASPNRDELDVLAEVAKLTQDQALKLRRRLVAQRAARTFSVEQGDFVVEDKIDFPIIPGAELDIRAVVYFGARANLSEERLAREVGQLGGHFKLTTGGVGDLQQYGFTAHDRPVLQQLAAGAGLDELERAAPDGVGVRGVQAIVYALVSCNACEVGPARAPAKRPTTPPPRPTAQQIPVVRAPTPQPFPSRPPTGQLPVTRIPTDELPAGASGPHSGPFVTRVQTSGTGPNPTVGRAPSSAGAPTVGRAPSTGPVVSRASSTGPNPALGRAPSSSGSGSGSGSGAQQPGSNTPGSGPIPRVPTRPPSGELPTVARTPSTISTAAPLPRTPSSSSPPATRPSSQRIPTVSRTGSPQGPGALGSGPTRQPTGTYKPIVSRTTSSSGPYVLRPPGTSGPIPTVGRAPTPTGPQVARAPSQQIKGASETEVLIRDRLALLDRGADHFVLLGIAQDASQDVTRAAYFSLARKLHPDRLASLGVVDAHRDGQRLFAQINAAFAVLSDPAKRAVYVELLGRGGESAVRAEEAKADELAMRAMHAEEAFRRGEMALRREQLAEAQLEFTTAVELQPNEPEYEALLLWTKFAAADDKAAIAQDTRRQLQRAAEKSRTPTAMFYLARVERILGREREALSRFQEVLRMKPNHSAAAAEVRVLEARLKKRRDG